MRRAGTAWIRSGRGGISSRGLFLGLTLLALPAPARASLSQPNGTPIPSPLGCSGNRPVGLAATFACVCSTAGVCNIGAPCASQTSCDDGHHATCETTLRHAFNDNTCIPSIVEGLNPWTEAAITPETFRPTCPLTFTVLTRGTARFQNAFGWYNVTGQRPLASDLHVMLPCDRTAGSTAVLDLRSDPAYRGGEIGFFIATPESHSTSGQCATGNCCATVARASAGEGYLYFSERRYNADNTGPNSYIHLITFNSHVTARKFFFAWEDSYNGALGDFTDLVTSVEGIECSGGGEACDTGRPGVCSYGVKVCRQGRLECQQLYQPGPEICDGVDNNCDGLIDNGATCAEHQICSNGRCVPHCKYSAACPPGLVCNQSNGRCVEDACASVTCSSDTICRGGNCVTPCQGVVCPHGQSCRSGVCLDPCEGVSCAQGDVCAEGVCVPGCAQCNGILCSAPLRCEDATGRCVDPSCAGGCPSGRYCQSGACVDACQGASCPSPQSCVGGRCVDPPPPDGGASVDGGASDGGGDVDGGATCPPTSPGVDTGCDGDGLVCIYPSGCSVARFLCTNGRWFVSIDPCDGGATDGGLCPSEPPTSGSACTVADLVCPYASECSVVGARCVNGHWSTVVAALCDGGAADGGARDGGAANDGGGGNRVDGGFGGGVGDRSGGCGCEHAGSGGGVAGLWLFAAAWVIARRGRRASSRGPGPRG